MEENTMQIFVLGGSVYKAGEEPQPFQAEVNALTLHWAKRLFVQNSLDHNFFVKEIKEVQLNEQT